MDHVWSFFLISGLGEVILLYWALDLGVLEILKEVAEEDPIYLHRLVIGVEGEVV